MARKARDPEHTGKEPTPPWKPDEPCPCGHGRLYAQCCLGIDGRVYKSPSGRRPPVPPTGFAHARCYMGWSQDCDQQISGERSEEHTSELQSRLHLVCRLLLEKK